jgi:hypothetical protein
MTDQLDPSGQEPLQPQADIQAPANPAPSDPAPITSAATDSVQPDWPTDWRQKASGGDEKVLKQLERYNSPADVSKALLELRGKLSSGEYKRNVAPPVDDVEAMKVWRTENGIPESPGGYEVKLGDGIVMGDADKPYVDEFVKSMHAKNMPPSAVNEALNAYFAMQNRQAAELAKEDRAFQQQAEEALRQEWGHEYLPNYNMAKEFATQRFGVEVGSAILQAGPDAVKAVASMAREINPAMTLVPNSANPTQAIADELKTLSGMIGTPEWYRDTAKQKRYVELKAAQERFSS